MHKIKTAIDGLRKHLHCDNTGISLLENVAQIANDLRKQAAGATEKELEAQRLANILREESRDLAMKVKRLEGELEKEQGLRKSCEHKIAKQASEIQSLQKTIDEWTPEIPVPEGNQQRMGRKVTVSSRSELPPLCDIREWTATLNSLRRKMRVAPRPMSRWKQPTADHMWRPYIYELTDIIKDYSGAECLKLGQFVVTLAMGNFPSVIKGERTLINTRIQGKEYGEDAMRPFVKWFFPKNVNIGPRPLGMDMPEPTYPTYRIEG